MERRSTFHADKCQRSMIRAAQHNAKRKTFLPRDGSRKNVESTKKYCGLQTTTQNLQEFAFLQNRISTNIEIPPDDFRNIHPSDSERRRCTMETSLPANRSARKPPGSLVHTPIFNDGPHFKNKVVKYQRSMIQTSQQHSERQDSLPRDYGNRTYERDKMFHHALKKRKHRSSEL